MLIFLLALLLSLFGTFSIASSSNVVEPDPLPGYVVLVLTPKAESATFLHSSPKAIPQMGLPSIDRLLREYGALELRESSVAALSDVAKRRYLLRVPVGKELQLVQTLVASDGEKGLIEGIYFR